MPCPGSLDRWERHYTYKWSAKLGEYDHSRIDIDLRQAGYEEFKGGRHIHQELPAFKGNIDDRIYDIALGEYDIAADKVTMYSCGPNI